MSADISQLQQWLDVKVGKVVPSATLPAQKFVIDGQPVPQAAPVPQRVEQPPSARPYHSDYQARLSDAVSKSVLAVLTKREQLKMQKLAIERMKMAEATRPLGGGQSQPANGQPTQRKPQGA